MNSLYFLLGISAFFPSVAIFHIGDSTGVQAFIVLCIIILIFKKDKIKIHKDAVKIISLILGVLIFELLWQLIFSDGKIDSLLKGYISFLLNFACIFLGASLYCGDKDCGFNFYAKGYCFGALISAVYASIQFAALYFLGISNQFFIGIHNNKGFADVVINPSFDVNGYGRAFAFCPEPAVLALLLLPAFAVNLWLKRYVSLVVILCGIYCTQSLTAIVFIAFICLTYRLKVNLVSNFEKIAYLLSGLFVIGIIIYLGEEIYSLLTLDGILNRGAGYDSDASSISRVNSLVAGLGGVMDKPILGWGVQSDELKQYLLDRSTVFEQNSSINSLLLSICAWFGVPVATLFFCVAVSAWKLKNKSHALFVMSSIWPAYITLNYYSIYSVWLCLGFVLGFFSTIWRR